MIAIDTNVIVRLLVNDDRAQAQKARTLLATETVYVAATVLLEVEWVLRSAYKLERTVIAHAVERFAGLDSVVIDPGIDVRGLLDRYLGGFDFADVLHVSASTRSTCLSFATFDTRLRRRADRTAFALPVIQP